MCGAFDKTMKNRILKFVAVILLIINFEVCGQLELSNPKSLSLVFVKTSLVQTFNDKINEGLHDIFEAIVQSDEYSIEDYVLMTFGDPKINDAKITTQPEDFHSFINSIFLEAGGNCPEMSLSRIKEGLEKSRPGPYLYVFTDASAKDIEILEKVKKIAKENECQVVFFLITTSNKTLCNAPMNFLNVMAYDELSEETSGRVFYLNMEKVQKVIDYIGVAVTSQRVIVRSKNYLEEGPNSSIFRVKRKTSGPTVKFCHRFSIDLPQNNESVNCNDALNPIADVKNYLVIQLKDDVGNLTSVEFTSKSYTVLNRHSLKSLGERQRLYVTEPLNIPEPPFRIKVNGNYTATKKRFFKFGYFVTETDNIVAPEITITGKNILEYGETLELTCNVKGCPKPKIEWIDDNGNQLEARIESEITIGSNKSILTLEEVKKDATYQCKAYNELGTDIKEIQIRVRQPSYCEILERPEDAKVIYNKSAVLHCKVNASFPTENKWYQTRRNQLEISDDGNTLQIKHALRSGVYICIVRDETNNKSIYNLKADVTVIYEAPEINKTIKEVRVKEETTAYLTCSILKGIPIPKIYWYRKIGNSLRIELNSNRNKPTIELKRPYNFDTATYICEARNGRESDKHYIKLFVECPPIIEGNKRMNETVTVKKHELFHMTCNVSGVPTPKVAWLKNGAPLETGIEIFRDYSFNIIAEEYNEGIYACTATNELGSKTKTVKFVVSYLKIISPPQQYKTKCSDKLTITCKIGGKPQPDIKWIFYSFYKSKLTTLPNTDNYLNFEKINLSDRGNYTCVANNTGNIMNVTEELDVLCGPKIQKQNIPYSAEDGDSELKMYCNATGNPKPAISWTASTGFKIAQDYTKYSMEKENYWLIIRNVSIDDPEEYTCEASTSPKKFMRSTLKVKIKRCPHAKHIKEITVDEGSRITLDCSIPPKTAVTFDPVWFKDHIRLSHSGNFYEITSVKVSQSGIYTCKVFVNSATQYTSTKVVVQSSVKEVRLMYGQNYDLDCTVSELSKPKVTWFYNGISDSYSKMVKTIKKNTQPTEAFYCTASNEYGHIMSRSLKLILTGCFLENGNYKPLITLTSGSVPPYKIIDGFTVVPQKASILLTCSDDIEHFDETTIEAICEEGIYVKIKGNTYNYKDINCRSKIELTEDVNDAPCLGANTKMIRQVFNVKGLRPIVAYETCVSSADGYPLYAKMTITYPIGTIPSNPIIAGGDISGDTCLKQKRHFNRLYKESVLANNRCCYTQRQLVNPKEVYPSQFQNSTFKKLNFVSHWSSCSSENWNDVEERVRRLANVSKVEPIVFTGVSGVLSISTKGNKSKVVFLPGDKRHPVPKYLWKVIQIPQKSSLAIIQVNSPNKKDTKPCKNICNKVPWMMSSNWENISRGYIFCCNLKSFNKAFNLGNIFVEDSEAVLDLI